MPSSINLRLGPHHPHRQRSKSLPQRRPKRRRAEAYSPDNSQATSQDLETPKQSPESPSMKCAAPPRGVRSTKSECETPNSFGRSTRHFRHKLKRRLENGRSESIGSKRRKRTHGTSHRVRFRTDPEPKVQHQRLHAGGGQAGAGRGNRYQPHVLPV